MANTRSGKKQIRRNERRRVINAARSTAVKTAIKKVRTAIENNSDRDTAETLLREVASQLNRAKSKGLIHPNAASRRLSRIAKQVAQQYRSE